MIKRFISIASIVLIAVTAAWAADIEQTTSINFQAAYYLDDNGGYGVADGGFAPISYTPQTGSPSVGGDSGRDLGSGWGSVEAKPFLNHTIKIPMLTVPGNALMADNNLKVDLSLGISPVSASGDIGLTFTPIAFLNFSTGLMLGTGWNAVIFDGVGKVNAVTGEFDTGSLEGVVLKYRVGGTFQFDLAALMPGDWNHVVVVANPSLEYGWFSGAADGELWMWEGDGGENRNGWKLKGTYLLGYQMPLRLDTVGLLVETEQYIGTAADLAGTSGRDWGADFLSVTLGPVFNFALTENQSLTLLVQLKSKKNYTDTTIYNLYARNRTVDGYYWDFHRLALSYTVEL